MSTLFKTHDALIQEIQKLQTLEQNCLQGLAHSDKEFQAFTSSSPSSDSCQQQFEKTEKAAMISTYTFLYVNNLKEEKMAELEKKIQEQKKLEKETEKSDCE